MSKTRKNKLGRGVWIFARRVERTPENLASSNHHHREFQIGQKKQRKAGQVKYSNTNPRSLLGLLTTSQTYLQTETMSSMRRILCRSRSDGVARVSDDVIDE